MNDVPTPTPPPEPPQPPATTPPPIPPTATAPPAGAAPGQVAPKPDKSGKAVASMVLGIVALVSLFCAWLVFQIPVLILGILAIVFGQMAKKEIAETPGLGGADQAKAGFIMGIVATVLGGIGFIVMIILAAA
ncbi:MAG: DUF4190 domain-containing protein [Thermoleophilia bacterium]|nr:DUF4190 domain-containing protein [Thermoleophilia bacterium]